MNFYRHNLCFERYKLNPCFNGIQKYSGGHLYAMTPESLNPCSNGMLKYHHKRRAMLARLLVLILVLMEY